MDAFVDVADMFLLLRDDVLLMLYQAVEGLVELLVGGVGCNGTAKGKGKEKEDDDQGDLFHGSRGLMDRKLRRKDREYIFLLQIFGRKREEIRVERI